MTYVLKKEGYYYTFNIYQYIFIKCLRMVHSRYMGNMIKKSNMIYFGLIHH